MSLVTTQAEMLALTAGDCGHSGNGRTATCWLLDPTLVNRLDVTEKLIF